MLSHIWDIFSFFFPWDKGDGERRQEEGENSPYVWKHKSLTPLGPLAMKNSVLLLEAGNGEGGGGRDREGRGGKESENPHMYDLYMKALVINLFGATAYEKFSYLLEPGIGGGMKKKEEEKDKIPYICESIQLNLALTGPPLTEFPL